MEPWEVPLVAISDARLLGALTLRSRVALKRELQRLARTHCATCASLSTATERGQRAVTIEHAGDPTTLPSSTDLGGTCAVVCEQRTLVCRDGELREVVLLYHRLCMGAPMLVLALVDCRAPFTDILTDDIEETAERIESILVEVLDPVPAKEATRRPRAAPR